MLALKLFLAAAPVWAGGADTTLTASVSSEAKLGLVPPQVPAPILPVDTRCGKCGDKCVRNGRPGYCGPNGACRVIRPKCPGDICPVLDCPALTCLASEQTTASDARGCKKCPVCPLPVGCTSDADCKPGWHCIRTGFIGKCVPSISPVPLPCADDSATATADASGAMIMPMHCIPPKRCINGQCKDCPAIRCANPNCDGPTTTPTDSNGCPLCPICSCTDDSCPAGQQCIGGKCQPRRCSSLPITASATAVAETSRASSMMPLPFPFHPCPTGYFCYEGICHLCPIVDCAFPLPCDGIMVPTTMANGCPGCPRCEGNICSSDNTCATGKQCIGGKCVLRRCSNGPLPMSASDSATMSMAPLGASLYPAYRCPPGQYCENGVCKPCPVLTCPKCPMSDTMMIPHDANGCPMCPRCDPCVGDSCLPCCPPVLREHQPACRDCGLRG